MSPRSGPQLGQRLAIAAFCCLTPVFYYCEWHPSFQRLAEQTCRLQPDTSPSAALAYQHPAADVSLAVFSMAKGLERRSMLRIAYATFAETAVKETGRRVDVTVVIGKTNEQDEVHLSLRGRTTGGWEADSTLPSLSKIMMNAEQRVHGDLVLLPGVENMFVAAFADRKSVV